jgi:hypothetical protein
MDAIEFAEKITGETLDQLRDVYDTQHERIYKFATLLASGAGAAGVYALGQVGTPAGRAVVWPVAAVSCWRFLIVAVLLLRGVLSNLLLAGTASAAIRERIGKHTVALKAESPDKDTSEGALWLTRWEQLAAMDLQILQYSGANTRRARVLDRAYWAFVASPLVAAAAYAAYTLTARYG